MSTEDKERSFKVVLTPSLSDFDNCCICHRYSSDVFCENANCTFSGHGRTQITCKFHPKKKYLLDITSCPYCNSNCLEIFVRSAVTEDKGSRRMPQAEELTDCSYKLVVGFLTYKQQPFVLNQKDLDEMYAVKLPREDYKVWRETMKRRCLVVEKKLQLLVNHKTKITRDDLQSMSDLLYEAGRFEQWSRLTASSKPVDYPVPPKFDGIKEKPSPMKGEMPLPIKKKTPEGFLCTPPSKAPMRSNIDKESLKKTPQMTPPSQMKQPNRKYSCPSSKPVDYPASPKFDGIKEMQSLMKGEMPLPMKKEMPLPMKKEMPLPMKKEMPLPMKKEMPEGFQCTPPSKAPMRSNIANESPRKTPQMTSPSQTKQPARKYSCPDRFYVPPYARKRENKPQFNENMNAINKNLGSLTLDKARPSQNTQAKPQTVQPPKNTPTVTYYQSLYTSEK